MKYIIPVFIISFCLTSCFSVLTTTRTNNINQAASNIKTIANNIRENKPAHASILDDQSKVIMAALDEQPLAASVDYYLLATDPFKAANISKKETSKKIDEMENELFSIKGITGIIASLVAGGGTAGLGLMLARSLNIPGVDNIIRTILPKSFEKEKAVEKEKKEVQDICATAKDTLTATQSAKLGLRILDQTLEENEEVWDVLSQVIKQKTNRQAGSIEQYFEYLFTTSASDNKNISLGKVQQMMTEAESEIQTRNGIPTNLL